MQEFLELYTKEAIRTESKVDKITVNADFLKSIMAMYIGAGNMLDQVKKHAFYSKEYDEDQLKKDFMGVVSGLDAFKENFDDMNVEEDLGVDPRIFHALVGIATESTEMLEALDLSGQTMDNVNLLEESFDVDWYQFILLDALNGNLRDVWDTGIEKLRVRYPDKFTSKLAINRDLDAERQVLDKLDDTE